MERKTQRLSSFFRIEVLVFRFYNKRFNAVSAFYYLELFDVIVMGVLDVTIQFIGSKKGKEQDENCNYWNWIRWVGERRMFCRVRS